MSQRLPNFSLVENFQWHPAFKPRTFHHRPLWVFRQNDYCLVQTELKSICEMVPGVVPHVFMDTQLQSPALDHINAVIIVSWLEQSLALLQLDKHHVSTELQKQRFLKVTQHPGARTQHTQKKKKNLHS